MKVYVVAENDEMENQKLVVWGVYTDRGVAERKKERVRLGDPDDVKIIEVTLR